MADEAIWAAARALRADRVHGAMELALQAVEAVDLLSAYPARDVRPVARALATARPRHGGNRQCGRTDPRV